MDESPSATGLQGGQIMRKSGLAIGVNSFVLGLAAAIAITALPAFGQTPIKLHGNKYSANDDVKLGREAAGQAEQQLQIMRDPELSSYVAGVGERLAAAIPPEFQHPEFQYTFKVVNAKEINAFALPGGPMYVNSGMITAARAEAEMAGVMAHEISHVALRHGTAQATKASKYNTLSSILGVGGQVLGGPIGTAAQMGSQGMGVYLLKFSREYEAEADLLGARIMAAAGYDPRDLANMFQTIEKQGGGGGGWFSDHPSAKDRYAKINQEAAMLKINTAATPDNGQFVAAQQHLTTGRPMMASNQPPGQGNSSANNSNSNSLNAPSGRVENPSARYQSHNKGPLTISVPENWREVGDQNGLWYAPTGGFGAVNGQNVFTHGVNIGLTQGKYENLQQATNEFLNSLQQGNANLRAQNNAQ